MKTTLAWLKEHLETEAPLAVIGERLTMLGHELESVEDRAAGLEPFTVAAVVSSEPHPNADRLKVCIVDTRKGQVQVVCGAPNAHTGMKGVFAPAGTIIPRTGALLKETVIRGVASRGMLCSAYELGLGDDHEGIIELPQDAPVGAPYAHIVGLGATVLDIKVTPNRADCLGVRGIARDLAAAGLGRLKPLDTTPVAGRFRSPIAIDIEDQIACPLFLGRHVSGLRNGPSPAWLQNRLEAVGLRPISALVDITNFLTFDVDRPLHVFDAGRLAGGLTVRLARPGETLLALNGQEYALDPEITVIADPAGVQSLGGVIGGEATACTEATTEVLIEAALFDPVRTAATGHRLNIASDARYRFERGLDPEFVRDGLEIATRLVLELCGGEASEVITAGAPPIGGADTCCAPSGRRASADSTYRTRRAPKSSTRSAARSRSSRATISRSSRPPGAATLSARPISSRRYCGSRATTRSRRCRSNERHRCRGRHWRRNSAGPSWSAAPSPSAG